MPNISFGSDYLLVSIQKWHLLAHAGVETQNSGARSQESGECRCRYAPIYLIMLSEPKAKPFGRARLRQGRLLSKTDALGLKYGKEARVEILIEETIKTAAIEGQALHSDSVRSSVARRLGLPTAGLPAAERVVDGLVDVLLDAGPGSFKGDLTTRKYVGMTKVSRATAYREISDLVAKQIFKQNPGRGRNVRYDIIWADKT